MSDNNVTRVGVAGVGSLGYHHTRIARDVDGTRLEGFFEPRTERAREVTEELGVPATDSLDQLLERIDALIIATPTSTHAFVALAALQRGIHVFIEKPIAASLEEADEILAAADRYGALVQVGHVERFNSALVAAEPYLDEPLFIESHRLSPFTERGTDVAVVLDLMIHDVDLVGSLVGHPMRAISATGVPVLTPSVDIANARIEFEGGAVANLTASRVSMDKLRKLRIFQRSGYLSLDLAAGTGEFLRLKAQLPALEGTDGDPSSLQSLTARNLWSLVDRIPLSSDDTEPLRREQEAFHQAIQGRRTPVVSGRDGRDALEVALSIEARIMSHVADSRTK
jgi:predicted dehydrogenase